MEIKVEIIARETIKPSSPTPNHLRNYKLSSRDQISPHYYIPTFFFYTKPTHNSTGGGGGDNKNKRDNNLCLKESLSKTLTLFYPLAGRLRDNLFVDCNDEGVDYFEARVIDCCLSDILEQPQVEEMNHLVPPEPTDFNKVPLLMIQVNSFPCGGLAVSVRMSHKIADGVALCAFVKAWSDVALGFLDTIVPDFTVASSRFPPREDFSMRSMEFIQKTDKIATKRFVVDASMVAALKAKTASPSVKQPTRVEAVTALVLKCAVAAASKSYALRLGTGKPTVPSSKAYALTGAVNLRPRLAPPIPKYAFGNLSGLLWAMIEDGGGEETDLAGLVCQLRKGVELSTDNSFTAKVGNIMKAMGDDMKLYRHSSWCRFPLYEADFGWGKPTYASAVFYGAPIGMGLLDTRDGDGVEVWMTLLKEDMALFEGDEELLAFASPNPSAL